MSKAMQEIQKQLTDCLHEQDECLNRARAAQRAFAVCVVLNETRDLYEMNCNALIDATTHLANEHSQMRELVNHERELRALLR